MSINDNKLSAPIVMGATCIDSKSEVLPSLIREITGVEKEEYDYFYAGDNLIAMEPTSELNFILKLLRTNKYIVYLCDGVYQISDSLMESLNGFKNTPYENKAALGMLNKMMTAEAVGGK